MSEEKKNRQQLACDYIHENYVAFNRLRYDLIAQKVQVCEEIIWAPDEPCRKPMSVSQLGMLLGKAGYRAVTRGSRNARVRGWIVYQRDTEEINANKRLIAQECVTT